MTRSGLRVRGTKRTCQACEVRFYDLARSPIVCPTCGAHYTPPAEPAVQAKARAPFGKTGWRSQPLKRVPPTPPDAEVMPSDRLDAEAVDEKIKEAATVDSEDGIVLEQQRDDMEDALSDTELPMPAAENHSGQDSPVK
jgi:uncharacterized protein (TIGR02300 family)